MQTHCSDHRIGVYKAAMYRSGAAVQGSTKLERNLESCDIAISHVIRKRHTNPRQGKIHKRQTPETDRLTSCNDRHEDLRHSAMIQTF